MNEPSLAEEVINYRNALVNGTIPYTKGQLSHDVNPTAYELWCIISKLTDLAEEELETQNRNTVLERNIL